MRLFVAVDPDATVRARIEAAVDRVRRQAPSARWVRPGGHHVTLAFLGEVDDARVPEIEAALASVAARHRAFSLRFRGGGGFGAPGRPRVLWMGFEGALDALAALQGDVAAALALLGFPEEARAFAPHLTLARARESGGDPALTAVLGALEGEHGESRVAELILYRSDLGPSGATYTALARSPLDLGPEL